MIPRAHSFSCVWISLNSGAATLATVACAVGCPFDESAKIVSSAPRKLYDFKFSVSKWGDHAAPTTSPVTRLTIAQMTMPMPPNQDFFFEGFEDEIEASSP